MGTDPDLLAPFDAADVASVAHGAATAVAADDVRAALRAHQRLVRDLRSVDGFVFEYRTEFGRDPVVARDEDAYYLRVPSRVWPEWGEALELDSTVLTAVRAVHERTVASVVGGRAGGRDVAGDEPSDVAGNDEPSDVAGENGSAVDDRDAMVIVRE